jgi:hypothetical protein
MEEEEREKLRDIFSRRYDECEGCPFLIEYAERLSWLHQDEEGRIMCGLLGGMEGDPEEDCKLIKSEKEETEDEYDI